ncbi:MAG: helix-hairpin-helix domain-containing protein [Longicatena sp.]
MKKIILVLFLLCLFYGRFEYVDLSKYGSTTKKIEVKGEVEKPGVYTTDVHASIKEILALAGGVKENGDTSHLNLTEDIVNHGVIVVKEKASKKLVSINSASLEELDTLSGIGPAVASRIIAYRTLHPFLTLEQLKEVKGIGDKLYDKLKDDIAL